jgi:branched-chain amino acid transport system permease protein
MWSSFGFEFVNFYLIPGLVLGCIYALGAIGITLTFGILRFANFAHGEVMMTGSYLTWTFTVLAGTLFGISLHPVIAAVPAVFVAIGISLLIDRLFYKPFRKTVRKCCIAIRSCLPAYPVVILIYTILPIKCGIYTQPFVYF